VKLTEQLRRVQRGIAEVSQRSRERLLRALRGVGVYWVEEWSNVSQVRLYAAVFAAGLVLIGGSYLAINRIASTGAWVRVFSNGTYVGMIPDNADVVSGVKRIADGYNVKVVLQPVHTHIENSYDWQSVANLPSQAVAVRYNGRVLTYLASQSDAFQVLRELKAAYTPKGLAKQATVRFLGNVQVQPTVVSVSSILTPTTALRLLLRSSMSRLTGRSGTLVHLISNAQSTSAQTRDAQSNQTQFHATTNAPQSTVKADATSTPLIKVEAQQQVTKVLPLAYPIHYLKDGHMGLGSVSVVTKGTPGKVKEQVLVTYINGRKSAQKVLKQVVLETPTAEVAKQGTNAGVASGVWSWPTNRYDITSGFGWRNLGGYSNFHPGIDVGVPIGSPVYATNDGVVIEAGWNSGGYGNWVRINNGNGIETVFGHMSEVDVHAGQMVAKGDLLGKSGDTGFSTGPHLHYEVRLNGTPIAPQQYM